MSCLYSANGGDLGEYVKELCWKSENVYVKTIASGKKIPRYMQEALEAELDKLEEILGLDKEALIAPLKYSSFLPDFSSTNIRLKEIYLHRTENIGKLGYGIYAKNRMFYVDEKGVITPVLYPDKTEISDLVDYESERQIVIDNTKALLSGKPSANILLTGDAVTGKSSTVKAIINAFWSEGLRIVEIRKDQLRIIPKVRHPFSKSFEIYFVY